MATKQDQVYAHGRSKYVAPSARLVIGSDDEHDPENVTQGTATQVDDEHDPENVPQGTATQVRPARATRATPIKVASGVITASQSDKGRTHTGTPSGSATHEEGASGSLGVSWSVEAFGSTKVLAPTTDTQSASSNEAESPDSTPGSSIGVLKPVANQLNRWCVDGQYQVYSYAKFLNDKGVMTRTLTLEMWVLTGSLPTMPDIHNLFTKHWLE